MAEKPYTLPTPARTHAQRSGFTAFRRADRGAPAKSRRNGPLISSEDVVLEAVKLGYKIADEQILKGQDFARKLRGAALRSEAGDMGNLVEHGLRLARQLAVLLVEITETSVQAPAIAKAFAKAVNEGSGDDAQAGSSPPARSTPGKAQSYGHTVPIRVTSERPTRVSLVLYEMLATCPDVCPLQIKGKKAEPLHEVSFASLGENAGYVLDIVITGGQEAGTYRGHAIDPSDGRPLGFIEVTVEAKK
jgi:hypothetical protein